MGESGNQSAAPPGASQDLLSGYENARKYQQTGSQKGPNSVRFSPRGD